MQRLTKQIIVSSIALAAIISLATLLFREGEVARGHNGVAIVNGPPESNRTRPIRLIGETQRIEQPRARPPETRKFGRNDEIVGALLNETPQGFPNSPLNLYNELRKEVRDVEWAENSESGLSGNLKRIPFMDNSLASRITCGRTICEIAGFIPSGLSINDMNVVLHDLQSGIITKYPDSSLDSIPLSQTFGQNKGRETYVIYFGRSNR